MRIPIEKEALTRVKLVVPRELDWWSVRYLLYQASPAMTRISVAAKDVTFVSLIGKHALRELEAMCEDLQPRKKDGP